MIQSKGPQKLEALEAKEEFSSAVSRQHVPANTLIS